jgi:hypothetical protein
MSARPGLESEIPMSTLMSNAFIKIGDTSQAAFFGPTNTPHDALTIQAVQLDLTDPEPFPPGAAIRFILTASDRYPPSPSAPQEIDTAFPVAAVLLDPPSSPNTFDIRARNTDTAQNGGSASFFWLAVAENVGPRKTLPIPINQTFIGQPASFSATNNIGDHQHFPNIFDPAHPAYNKGGRYAFNGTFGPGPFAPTSAGRPLVFATANNVGSGPLHNAAAVALVQDAFWDNQASPIDQKGFSLIARNSDTVAGVCGFNWVALQQGLTSALGMPQYPPGVPSPPDLTVDTGQSLEFTFRPTNQPGDWVTAEIQFSVPFFGAPVVLIGARVRLVDIGLGFGCMPVAIAQNVTRFGFTLAARNSDTNGNGGTAAFDWVAFGL